MSSFFLLKNILLLFEMFFDSIIDSVKYITVLSQMKQSISHTHTHSLHFV